MHRRKHRLPQFLRQEQGSFTLESAIVFPLLLVFVLIFIVFGMYMYQKVTLYYVASSTAERTAFSWDNSHRDPRSGMLTEPRYDGLYWRLGEDGIASGLFGLGSGDKARSLTLPQSGYSREGEEDLPLGKMLGAAELLERTGQSYEGQIQYANNLVKRAVEVKLKQPLSAGAGGQGYWSKEPKTVTASGIVDPVEFIRSVDLVRYFSSRFAGSGGAGQAQAGKIISPYQGAGR
ncbi:pilus assembly protein [Paenibacillus sp. N4]|uniref:TadE/TadG family type IV pilus assembly protein n=1 Tax=Paenibacillus vietnamensis TaxID=2590547 RepID=UPI001CD14063|nr:TadE family protein [Paenibacillus vietnamensis]MCA0757412.1 pilus assembly protein [Paenibacillus vietnamensis]